MNTSFRTVINESNDLPSCQLELSGEKEASGEYRLYGHNVRENLEKDSETGIIKQINTVTNTSETNIKVNRLSSVYADGIAKGFYDKDVLIHLCYFAWQGEAQWAAKTPLEMGIYPVAAHELCRGGRSVCGIGSWSTERYYPIVLIEDKTDNVTYFFEHQGGTSWEIELGTKGAPDALELTVEVNSLHESRIGTSLVLKPGECYSTLPVIYGEIAGTAEEALNTLLRYKRKNGKSMQKQLVCFNDYMNCLWAMPSDKKLIPLIDAAASVGAELFCIDAGWFVDRKENCSFGDWVPDDGKFGEYGFSGIIKYILDKGMIPGIWLEIETCSAGSEIYNLAENAVLKRCGNVVNGSHCFVNFKCKEVTDYLRKRIRSLYDLGIRYIKNDYNHSLGIGCDNNNDSSCGLGIVENYKAFCDFIDSVCDEMPDLIIENCGSGAMRCDSGTLSHFHLQSVSDQENYLNMPSIVWGMERCMPPEKCGIWAYPYPLCYADISKLDSLYDEAYAQGMADGEQTAFNMACGLFGIMYLSGHIEKCDSCNLELIRRAVECCKNDRDFVKTALPINLYPQQALYKKGYTVLALKNDSKLRIGIFKNGGGDILNIDLSEYVKQSSKLKEIYPLKDKSPLAVLKNGMLEFESNINIAARVFEIDI